MTSRPIRNDSLDDIYAELSSIEKTLNRIQNAKSKNLRYSGSDLPPYAAEGDIILGDATDTITLGNKSLYMYLEGQWWELRSVAEKLLVGPALYSTFVSTDYDTGGGPGSGSTGVWQPTMHDGSGEVYIGGRNIDYHRASPVWNWTFDRILYQEVSVPYGGFTPITRKLCLMDPDGGNRVVVHDSGDTTLNRYYHAYSVSPDGLKVAITNIYDWGTNKMRVYAADGSGMLGAMDVFEYATANWSLDSQYVYFYPSSGKVSRRKFDASDTTVQIHATSDTDYFYRSFGGDMFASSEFGTSPDGVIAFDLDDNTIALYTETDMAPFSGQSPVNCFWSEDDTKLIIDRQNMSFSGGTGDAIMFDINDPSSYIKFGPGNYPIPGTAAANPVFARSHPAMGWSLVKVNGVTKIATQMRQDYDASHEERYNATGLVAYDLETGVGEWLAYGISTGLDGDPYTRYSVTGTPIGTWYFGAQIYFNP